MTRCIRFFPALVRPDAPAEVPPTRSLHPPEIWCDLTRLSDGLFAGRVCQEREVTRAARTRPAGTIAFGSLNMNVLAGSGPRRIESRQNTRVKALRAGFARGGPQADGLVALEGRHLL